jgi:hypothetical protein
MSRSIFEGLGAAKEVLQNSKPIFTIASKLGTLHRVLELKYLARKLIGIGGVQLQSQTKHTIFTNSIQLSRDDVCILSVDHHICVFGRALPTAPPLFLGEA